ncbi:MAG: LuxR C-terminal-related transcriptional regulator, partial [Anaerolineales bacterium]
MTSPIDPEAPLVEPLTRRELEVLRLLAKDHSRPEIAEQLTVTLSSVKFHIQNIYGKLGANSKRQALARAGALGLLGDASRAASPVNGGPGVQSALGQPATSASPENSRHNLPVQVTRFFGREKEIEQLKDRLGHERLVTLTGAGGSGKTRLALEAAGGLLEAYSGGVWLVELAPLTEAWLVPGGVAAALGLPEVPGRAVTAVLLDYLRPKQLLLVLDNCEHLVQACAELAESLLRACAQLTILATSREALNIAGEATFQVPTLASPAEHDLTSVEALGGYEAVRLFVDRAQAGRPGFQMTYANARAVGQVCRQLDGIPLAIELAAARMKVLGVEEIAAGLDNRFQLLRGGS